MSIRTTVTLDRDVYERIQEESLRRRIPVKETINEVLRAGFLARQTRSSKRFEIDAKPMGVRPGIDYDDVEGLIEISEGPSHR